MYKNCEIPKKYSPLLKKFLNDNGIKFESSEAYNLIHFECDVKSKEQEEIVNSFTDTLGRGEP